MFLPLIFAWKQSEGHGYEIREIGIGNSFSVKGLDGDPIIRER